MYARCSFPLYTYHKHNTPTPKLCTKLIDIYPKFEKIPFDSICFTNFFFRFFFCFFRSLCSACKLSDKTRADRLAQPRMSLLGKPINYNRGARRDARYRRLQSRVYNFLERPRGVPAILYHVIV